MRHVRTYLKIMEEIQKEEIRSLSSDSGLKMIYNIAFSSLVMEDFPIDNDDERGVLYLETDGDYHELNKKTFFEMIGLLDRYSKENASDQPVTPAKKENEKVTPEIEAINDIEDFDADDDIDDIDEIEERIENREEQESESPTNHSIEESVVSAEKEEPMEFETKAISENQSNAQESAQDINDLKENNPQKNVDQTGTQTTASIPPLMRPNRNPSGKSKLVEGVDYIGKPPIDNENRKSDTDVHKTAGEPTDNMQSIPKSENSQVGATENDVQKIAKPTNTDGTEQYILDEKEFPPYMKKDDFTFYYTHITVTDDAGKREEAEIIVAPLSLKEGTEDIVMWADTNTGSKMAISKRDNKRKSVLLHLDDMADIIVKGTVNDGKFNAEISLTNKEISAGYKLEEGSMSMEGSWGHILQYDDNVDVHIVPSSFNNSNYGDADFFYVIDDGQDYILGDTSKKDIPKFVSDGATYKIRARWTKENGVSVLDTQIKEA